MTEDQSAGSGDPGYLGPQWCSLTEQALHGSEVENLEASHAGAVKLPGNRLGFSTCRFPEEGGSLLDVNKLWVNPIDQCGVLGDLFGAL